MFKTFIVGVVLGLAAAGGAAFVLPVTDLHRESSLVSVQPNGGNSELFHIRIPDDRIIGGGKDVLTPTPGSLQWPVSAGLDALQLELFKLRNRDGVVVGLASRIAVSVPGSPGALEWVLHIPARGTLYFPMSANTAEDGYRRGLLRAGTGEFGQRTGSLREHYVEGASDGEGQIELQSSSLGQLAPEAEGS